MTAPFFIKCCFGVFPSNEHYQALRLPQNPKATRSYFQPATKKGQNPLPHSGLLLTGANKTLAGEKSEDSEDSIHIAYQALNFNPDNTDLVVLSVCETGLGEIKNGEGV